MRPASPLSLLLFIHLASALPVPNILSDCWRYGSCRNAIIEIPVPDAAPDPYIPREADAVEEAPPAASTTVEMIEITAAPKDIPGLIAAALHVEDMKENSRHDNLVAPSDYDKRLLSWCKQLSRQAWRNSREYSELLVISIVFLFFLLLTAWEAAWSGRGRKSSNGDARGPVYLSDDEEASLSRESSPSRTLLDEKSGFLKDKPKRWARGRPCCAEHANSTTRTTCDDLSASQLISKCVRGVCEL